MSSKQLSRMLRRIADNLSNADKIRGLPRDDREARAHQIGGVILVASLIASILGVIVYIILKS